GAPPKVRSMVHSVADLDVITVRNEAEALLTESALIKQYRPRFNIVLRDDKRYLALRADPRDPVPRLATCRILRDDNALYFGPFPSAAVVRAVLDFTEKRYGLRKCTPIRPDAETYRHCINDIVRFCSAPCVGRVSPEAYRARFDEACAFLRGERPGVIEEVKAQMQAAAEAHDYEKAAALRDTWMALREMVKQRARVVATPGMRADDARAGLRELQRLIGLPALPTLIEGFDISNLFGTYSVASMVAASDGLPDRRLYRRFRIRTVEGADDPRSMAEVIGRRYARQRDEGKPLPGLILIDGGVTQLRASREALSALGLSHVPSVGLAKEREEIVLDDGRPPLLLPRDSDALRVLTRLRDEAHRFAVDHHRRLRNRLIRESALDEIPGIGPAKKAALFKRFGSVYRLARAAPDNIASVPGIGRSLADAILRAVTPRDVT
ncbi:MAG: helix-hairpin-helix domain-containing protein, partial [Kiritimatiellae bacterium]|nr:helix-hairpin-helix domain-containing protein [Kiritimatiellia bacterium]